MAPSPHLPLPPRPWASASALTATVLSLGGIITAGLVYLVAAVFFPVLGPWAQPVIAAEVMVALPLALSFGEVLVQRMAHERALLGQPRTTSRSPAHRGRAALGGACSSAAVRSWDAALDVHGHR